MEDVSRDLDVSHVPGLPVLAMVTRGINEEMARLYGVRTEMDPETGRPVAYYFPLQKDGEIKGYQRKAIREPGQRQKFDCARVGDTKGCDPFGAHIMKAGGKFLIVTEGAEDAMAAAQMLRDAGKNYRVVATLGTDGWKRQIEWLNRWECVVIAYDQDEAGKKAARELASALRPGVAKVMTWPSKYSDPNAALIAGVGSRWVDRLMKAEAFRPDGILGGEQMWELLENYTAPPSIPYPEEWTLLNHKMGGMRAGEISLWTGGTSVGKTSYVRRLKQHILANTEWRIGEIELEERPVKTGRGLLEFQGGKRLGDMTPDEKRAAWAATYGTGRIITLDHSSQYTKGQDLMGRLQYLHYAHGANLITLDHITLAVSQFGDGSGGLQEQDAMMAGFLEFVEKTDCHLMLVSHLRKAPTGGVSFEEGAIPSLDDLKGSGSLKQISFDIIGVSRNSQAEDDYERNCSQMHVLKCREHGNTGRADILYFDSHTRQLVPAQSPDAVGEEEF